MRLKIGVQKNGKLSEGTFRLFKECDIHFPDNEKAKLKVSSLNFPIDIFNFRNSDIPRYLKENYIDVAVVGENTVIEQQCKFKKHLALGFGQTRLSICVPDKKKIKNFHDINGMTIATSYPNSLRSFLNNKKLKAHAHYLAGSVELATNLGFADAICDLVSTGNTILNHGLKEYYKILDSEACIFSKTLNNKEKKEILEKLIFRIKTIQQAKKYKYIMMNIHHKNLQNVLDILPGLKSPTISQLGVKDWKCIHTVIDREKFWTILEDLKRAGAKGIVVSPIENIVV